ncbi:MAG: type IV pilus assembly protein PilM [Planctomycetota bacterium]|jgi:type IV pilus assembly protein PilM
MGLNLLKKNQVELVGLDIGSTSVKLVQLTKAGDAYTADKAVYEMIRCDSDDENARKDACVEAVKRCFAKAGIKPQQVVCSLAGPEVIVRGFNFKPIPMENLQQAIYYEARQVCPLDMSKSVMDYQLVESPELAKKEKVAPRNGIMVIAAQQTIKDHMSMLQEAGVSPLMIDVESLALLNCLNELDYVKQMQTVAVINVGNACTSVVIYGRNGLPFVRDLNHSGGQVVQQISEQLQIEPAQVQQALSSDSQSSDEVRNQVLLAMNDAIRSLTMSINETLRFYSFQEKDAAIEKVFLCGGFSLVDTFVDFLTDSLAVETEILNPFDKIQCCAGTEGNEMLKTCGSALAVATGLAMRTL